MTEYLIEVSGSLPPLQGSCTVADYDANPNGTFCSAADYEFDDTISTGFDRKQ